jgi:hypothetical protein
MQGGHSEGGTTCHTTPSHFENHDTSKKYNELTWHCQWHLSIRLEYTYDDECWKQLEERPVMEVRQDSASYHNAKAGNGSEERQAEVGIVPHIVSDVLHHPQRDCAYQKILVMSKAE